MTLLSLHNLQPADHPVAPAASARLGLHSPARALFTDFRSHEPHVIDDWMHAIDARRQMRQTHDEVAIVVDRGGHMTGTILLDDLSEERLMRRVSRGERREEIRVFDLMTHRHYIRALWIDELDHANVADVIETLRSHGERICMVVDREAHEIRGLIAANEMPRRVRATIDLSWTPTFAVIYPTDHC